ncbi:hypothetical protein J41TS8_15550 [Bacillus sp. J41TS8]|nr:hypothetical protein J41TS8_15550 [Bacillus sp. J41TS8]
MIYNGVSYSKKSAGGTTGTFLSAHVLSNQWKSVNDESGDMGDDNVENKEYDHERVSCRRKAAGHVEKEEDPH